MNTKTLAILLSDTYKQVHNKMLPPGLTKLVSYWTPRRSMLKYQKRMVFFGLQAFVQEYLIEYFNTWFFKLPESLIASTYISTMNIQLTSKDYDLDPIIKLHRLGYLPLHIRALPEGYSGSVVKTKI